MRSPLGPNKTLHQAWVATAPTPALAHGTTDPTAINLDCTADAEVSIARVKRNNREGRRHLGSYEIVHQTTILSRQLKKTKLIKVRPAS